MTSSNCSARDWVNALNLLPHPEGGFYRETYRSPLIITHSALQEKFPGDRSCATAIYYLLESGDFSAFHRIRSDELWHFHDGGSLLIHILNATGYQQLRLGKDWRNGDSLQCMVPADTWFAACPSPGTAYCLAGCTVSPGFDFNDFQLADARELTKEFPEQAQLIRQLVRD